MVEAVIETKMRALGLTARHLASIDQQISDSRISIAFRGIRPLANEDVVRLFALLRELEVLVEWAKPFPVDLTDPRIVRDLLIDLREKSLAIKLLQNITHMSARESGQLQQAEGQ